MAPVPEPKASHALRCVVRGDVQAVGLRDATVTRARELGALGWVRNGDEGEVLVHAEGTKVAVEGLVAFLGDDPASARVDDTEVETVEPEGHEQFAVRGVSAGRFEVVERTSGGGGFELRLEVEGTMRGWALPKGPSMDPAVKRMAFEAGAGADDAGSIWDDGAYEQGGRVPWPEAIERGHAVFVLHGAHLNGGFALQRIRAGARPQWLLIKRDDERARRGSDVVADSGR
jgi:acylphosphatase